MISAAIEPTATEAFVRIGRVSTTNSEHRKVVVNEISSVHVEARMERAKVVVHFKEDVAEVIVDRVGRLFCVFGIISAFLALYFTSWASFSDFAVMLTTSFVLFALAYQVNRDKAWILK